MEEKSVAIKDARTLGVPKMLLLGLQHMFAMFGATILVPILVNNYFEGEGLSIQVTLICAGLGTLFFHLCSKLKVPAFLGSSFAFLGGFAPENAGQIVCPAEGSGDSQHHVADFPAQGRAAVDELPAQGSLQGNLIDGCAVLADDVTGKDENQQSAPTVFPEIVGAHLAGDGEHFPIGQIDFI